MAKRKSAVSKKSAGNVGGEIAANGANEHHHWQFMPIFPPFQQESLEAAILESQCGSGDESQPVEQYDGLLGVSKAFVANHQAAVGQLQWNDDLANIYDNPGNVAGVRWCTGTLISEDLFLTAGHCFDQTGGGWQRPKIDGTFNVIPVEEIAANMHVNFNYQVDKNGDLREEQQYAIVELVEYRLGGLDFAIARLENNPGHIFGWTEVSTTDSVKGDMLCLIQHPAGQPKRIEAGLTFHLHDDRIGYNDIDTLGGSSGSGILRELDGKIVGVHTNGGCNVDMTGHNHGVRITSILAASPTLSTVIIASGFNQVARYYSRWDFDDHQGRIALYDAKNSTIDNRVYANVKEFYLIVDMLRNEKPLWFDASTKHLRTGYGVVGEPIGEEENFLPVS